MDHMQKENSSHGMVSMVNIQEPVRDMLLHLTKAARENASQIEELDRQLKEQRQQQRQSGKRPMEREEVEALVEEMLRATRSSPSKAAAQQAALVEERLAASDLQVAQLKELVQHQSAAISDLHSRLERATNEIEVLTHDGNPVLTYVDRQVQWLVSEFDRKLAAAKAEQQQQAEQQAHPAIRRSEESVRALSNAVADLRMEVDRKAGKEQFLSLAAQKADHSEFVEILATVHEKVSLTQLTSTVTSQVKPLVQAVAALEKAVVIQDANFKLGRHSSSSSSSSAGSSSRSAEQQQQPFSLQQHLDRRLAASAPPPPAAAAAAGGAGAAALDQAHLADLVDGLLRSRRIGEVTQATLDAALFRAHDSVLREATALAEQGQHDLQERLGRDRDRHAAALHALERRLTELSLAVSAQGAAVAAAKDEARGKADREEVDRLNTTVKSLGVAVQELEDESGALFDHAIAEASFIRKGQGQQAAVLDDDASFADALDYTPARRRTAPVSPIPTLLHSGRRGSTAAAAAAASAGKSARRASSALYAATPRKSQAIEALRALETLHGEAEGLRGSLRGVQARAAKAEAEAAALRTTLEEERKEREKAVAAAATAAAAAAAVQHREAQFSSSSSSNAVNTEWRLALGELGASLRRELADKLPRAEMQHLSSLAPELARIEGVVTNLSRELSHKGEADDVAKLTNALQALTGRVVSELTGGLWLSTSRQLIGEACIVPWDTQVVNAAPASLLWRKGSGLVTIRVPGLYRVCVSFFTTTAASVTLCLNDEPMLVLQPSTAPPQVPAHSDFSMAAYLTACMHRDERYVLRRFRHSAGDVTSVSLEEIVSLPADAVLSARLQSATPAQAVLAIRKL